MMNLTKNAARIRVEELRGFALVGKLSEEYLEELRRGLEEVLEEVKGELHARRVRQALGELATVFPPAEDEDEGDTARARREARTAWEAEASSGEGEGEP